MGLMRTAHDVTVVMERTAHYFIFGSHRTKICQRQSTQRDNGPHEDSSRCDCGDGENGHYLIFVKTVDAFQQLLHDTEQYLNAYFNRISSQIMFVNNVLTS